MDLLDYFTLYRYSSEFLIIYWSNLEVNIVLFILFFPQRLDKKIIKKKTGWYEIRSLILEWKFNQYMKYLKLGSYFYLWVPVEQIYIL